MTTPLIPLKPRDVARRLSAGAAVLIDIRESEEFTTRHVAGALSRPLSRFDPKGLGVEAGREVIFTCRTGMRTAAHCNRLADAVGGAAFVLEGGLDAWAAVGLPVAEGVGGA
jgi:rhodanese-related sulfurtransferase